MGIEPTTSAWKAEVLPLNYTRKMVGKTGFEPATPWSQTKCSAKLSYFPLYFQNKKRISSSTSWKFIIKINNSNLKTNGAPERSRTPNLLIRSQTLYPIELRALIYGAVERTRTSTGSTPTRPST